MVLCYMDPNVTSPKQKSPKQLEKVTQQLSQKGTVTLTGNRMTFVVDNLAEQIKRSTKSDDESSRASNCSSASTSGWSDIPAVDGDILDSLEHQTKQLSASLDRVFENMTKKLHEASAITVGYSQTYSDASKEMGQEADEAVRSMYMLIAHCEELDKAMEPVHKVSQKIKHVKTVLSALEAQIV